MFAPVTLRDGIGEVTRIGGRIDNQGKDDVGTRGTSSEGKERKGLHSGSPKT